MKIYTYIMTVDAGFAPNPFHGWLTLACCKPGIRKIAKKGDWVVGITSAREGPQRLIHAMKVEEVLAFDDYWSDTRFRKKRPTWTHKTNSPPTVASRGDNCFEPRGGGEYLQLPCCHNRREQGRLRRADECRDLRGENVLVSKHFAYFGAGTRAKPWPKRLNFAIPGIGFKSRFSAERHRLLLAFITRLPLGRHGLPREFVANGGRLTGAGTRTSCG